MSDFDTVLNMSQTLLQGEAGTEPLPREAIAEAVDRVIAINPAWADSVDRDKVIRELEARFSIWIGREQVLTDDEDDHVQWLAAERMEEWRYWPRYRRFLEREGKLAPASVVALDRVTGNVLRLLEDPDREGPWDRRGLVVGHIQSGKTANYIGLICKAADAGYKVIIVLAGMHKNLRSQTQMRLDEGFLGYETRPHREVNDRGLRVIGVGIEDSDPELRPNYATHRDDNGDLNRTVANSFGIQPGGRPLVFVLKKNASVLRNLLYWIERVADTHDAPTERHIVSEAPLLLIDDEADHASVDTGEQSFDEDGTPDPDHEPKTINRLIRRILYSFSKSAYVGHTATPFANIFIHDRGRTTSEGDDLFPRSFIMNLPAPSDYAGPARIFGLDPDDELGEVVAPLDLVHHIWDHADTPALDETEGWIPPRHRSFHVPLFHGQDRVPDSLRQALLAFVLSCAARRARGNERAHNSMLIHVTRFTRVQRAVVKQVSEEFNRIRNGVRFGDGGSERGVLDKLRQLWEDDFVPTTASVRHELQDPSISVLSWGEIERQLPNVVEDIWLAGIREINGTARDILDYDTHKDMGLCVIAVGGDKLSRGLTLEGLTVSYFLRASKMYDTLMQMGRWFGYRPGYLDLCRLYTTPDLEQWFQHIAEASEELRQEFDHMSAIGGTPKQYGLKVRSHPVLMVTSRVKMRHHATLELSFAGSMKETVVFHRDRDTVQRNLQTVEATVAALGPPNETDPERERPEGSSHRWRKTYVWNNVPAHGVTEFLGRFQTHPEAVKVDCQLLSEYIEGQLRRDELVEWTVAVVSGGAGGPGVIAGLPVDLIDRAPNTRCYSVEEQRRLGRYLIRRLLAPRDEAIDLGFTAYAAALEQTVNEWHRDHGRSGRTEPPTMPSGPSMRANRSPQNGLLLVYPLDPGKAQLDHDVPVIGFGISFPASENAETVTYKVNNIYWAQETGDAVST